MKKQLHEITLTGTLTGKIWLPPVECEKQFEEKFSPDEHKPFRHYWNGMRDALLHITNDGDFQHCAVWECYAKITYFVPDTNRYEVLYREILPCKAIADMFALPTKGLNT